MKRLFDIPYHQLNNYPKNDMFSTKSNGFWTPISTKEFLELVNKTAKGLIAVGINPGDKIGIISTNRFEWNALDIAALEIGAIVVPIYPNISSEDYIYIFNDSKIKLCVVGDSSLFSKINELKSDIPELKYLFSFNKGENIPHWHEIHINASSISDIEVQSRKEKIENLNLATIIYTSGTTGNPKGVMLSHNNILSNVTSCIDRMPCDENSKVLTFLPVCHVYERMLHYLYMYMGCSIFFAESMDTIGENIKEVKPHMFSAVPRLIEKVYEKIITKGE